MFKTFLKHDGKACIGEITPQELWELYAKDLKINPKSIDDYSQFWVDSFKPIPSMHAVIKEAIKKYRVGLITNIYYESFDKMTEQDLVPKLNYETVVQSCDIGMVKTGKEIFEIAQEKIGEEVEKGEVLFIDDSKDNIESAKEFGWQTFQFDDNNEDESARELGKMFGIEV